MSNVKQLILSGNPNLDTVRGAVYFANQEFEGEIERVHFLDTDTSLRKDGNTIEGERNDLVRKYIPDAQLVSTRISFSDMHLSIPRILSQELKLYERDQIIVDLTNGTKSISSVLYASASLSKISRLFFLNTSPDKRDLPPEDLESEDYSTKILPALENIGEIGKYSYFEIVYYLERVGELSAKFEETSLDDDYLEQGMVSDLQQAVRSYFRGDYSQCIQKVGQIMEAFSGVIVNNIRNKAKGDIKTSAKQGFKGKTDWLRANFCEELRGKLASSSGLKEYEQSLKELANIDVILETIRVHRNMSSHGYSILRGEEEAKVVVTNALYLLGLILKTEAFS